MAWLYSRCKLLPAPYHVRKQAGAIQAALQLLMQLVYRQGECMGTCIGVLHEELAWGLA